MTVRYEWLTATATHAALVEPGDTAPDGQTADDGNSVLVLSHGDSYGVAIEGTPDQLLAMLGRAVMTVKRWEWSRDDQR